MDIEARFARTIIDADWLARDQGVLVGVSGGADSVALLHLLHSLNHREGWSIRLHVAHLDHQLRGEASRSDAEFVRELSHTLGLPSTVESVDVRQRARKEGVSLEQAGRVARLEFFERVCLASEVKVVALAHQADDNAETVLHRMIRGTGIRGLAGIRAKRPLRTGSDIFLIRPMLQLRRFEIEEYLREKSIPFRQDASNLSHEFMRNRIRHQLMPLLREQFNPQVEEALTRLAEQCRSLDDYVEQVGQHILESVLIRQDDRQLVLDAAALAKKPPVIRAQVIRQACTRLGIGEGQMTFANLNAAAELVAERAGSKTVDLPGARITRRYSELEIERASADCGNDTAVFQTTAKHVAMNTTTLLPEYGQELTVEEIEPDADSIGAYLKRQAQRDETSNEEWMDADSIHPPLLIRTRQAGDRFFPLGMSGVKKLSDFFIDLKIDAQQRERVPLLCDQMGPIWIIPFRIDQRVRLTPTTQRVLRVIIAKPE